MIKIRGTKLTFKDSLSLKNFQFLNIYIYKAAGKSSQVKSVCYLCVRLHTHVCVCLQQVDVCIQQMDVCVYCLLMLITKLLHYPHKLQMVSLMKVFILANSYLKGFKILSIELPLPRLIREAINRNRDKLVHLGSLLGLLMLENIFIHILLEYFY